MKHSLIPRRTGRAFTATRLAAALYLLGLGGCVVYPSKTGPFLSRLPPAQPGAASSRQARTLTPEEKRRYDQIDRQVLREQNQALANRAAAAWRDYYAYAPPATVCGSYYEPWGSYGGWGYPYAWRGWGMYYGW